MYIAIHWACVCECVWPDDITLIISLWGVWNLIKKNIVNLTAIAKLAFEHTKSMIFFRLIKFIRFLSEQFRWFIWPLLKRKYHLIAMTKWIQLKIQFFQHVNVWLGILWLFTSTFCARKGAIEFTTSPNDIWAFQMLCIKTFSITGICIAHWIQ